MEVTLLSGGRKPKKLEFIRNCDKDSQVEQRVIKSGEEKQIKPSMFIDIYWFRPNFSKQCKEFYG